MDYANLPQRPRCAACGYDRSGTLHTPTCPECGYDNLPDAITLAGWNSNYTLLGIPLDRSPTIKVVCLCLLIVAGVGMTSHALFHARYLHSAIGAWMTFQFVSMLWRRVFVNGGDQPPATLLVAPDGLAIRPGWAARQLDPYQPDWQAELVTKARHSRITIRKLSKWGWLSIFSEPLIDFTFEHNSPEQAQGVMQIIQAGIDRAKTAAQH